MHAPSESHAIILPRPYWVKIFLQLQLNAVLGQCMVMHLFLILTFKFIIKLDCRQTGFFICNFAYILNFGVRKQSNNYVEVQHFLIVYLHAGTLLFIARLPKKACNKSNLLLKS